MTGTKKRHSAAFRARVALEAAKQTRTLAGLTGTFQVHSVQISKTRGPNLRHRSTPTARRRPGSR